MEQVQFGDRLLELLMSSLAAALPGCAGVGLSVAPNPGTGRCAGASGVAAELDAAQWAAGDGPVVEAAGADGAVTTDDLGSDPRWPGFSRPADAGGLAVIAVPGGWDENGPMVLSVYTKQPADPAALAVIDRYEPLLATGLGVVEYCTDELVKADEMIDMMRRRRLIEQAKGMVMGRAGLDAERAFELLVRVSQQQNVKIRDLAAALVQEAPGTPRPTARPGPPPSDAARVARQLWRHLGPGASGRGA
ncbi:ANTAR domain-containing protein [Pseudonocardia acidicola]|uniref:ANTAR domain-containing protein n=1 Tax=Pseudonocardia acidicola TaxID=2724939 RepID=A0ABX1SH62_9PSEU|nr:ANTAR domain-containing protein [Pseudonocardia acidicola]NMH99604.1 ANTAR domain-containing protein [Pseudonocardia acidicola]